jgi:hypothetical protein
MPDLAVPVIEYSAVLQGWLLTASNVCVLALALIASLGADVFVWETH